MNELKNIIREIPDFPKPGILFYDLTTLMNDARGFRSALDGLAERYQGVQVDAVVGIEARGFIFAPTVAYRLGCGFIPARKPGKLPGETVKVTYDLEYGTDSLEIHQGAIQPDQRILIVDDLIATGGTAAAVARLVEKMGGDLVGLAFLVELEFLNGRKDLEGWEVFSLVKY